MENCSTTDPCSTELGLINGSTIRPTLYTFQMVKHFGDQQVHAASDVKTLSAQSVTLVVIP